METWPIVAAAVHLGGAAYLAYLGARLAISWSYHRAKPGSISPSNVQTTHNEKDGFAACVRGPVIFTFDIKGFAMPEALPTAILSAMFWATIGASFVRFKSQATYDQLAVLWLMAAFGFALAGAPLIVILGWKFGLVFGAIAAVAPAIAFRYHMGSTSSGRSERWSIALYAILLLVCAAAVSLSGAIFVEDFRAVSGLSTITTTMVLLAAVLVVGITGVLSALELKVAGH